MDDEWETDSQMLRDACAKYKVFPKMDVCSTVENYKFENYFTKYYDGLTQDWDEDFFMNPPYSEVDTWMPKAYYEHRKNNVNGLILVYSKTDTKWWHKYVEGKAEVHFIEGRVKFLKDGIKSKNSAPYPSCWIIYRKK